VLQLSKDGVKNELASYFCFTFLLLQLRVKICYLFMAKEKLFEILFRGQQLYHKMCAIIPGCGQL
jgi:hypothetical protein